jgi:hypothetical protein
MSSPRPGVASTPNYFREAFPDFKPGNGPLIDADSILLTGEPAEFLEDLGDSANGAAIALHVNTLRDILIDFGLMAADD